METDPPHSATPMKTKSHQDNIHSHSGLSRLRLATVGTLFLAAAALAATAMQRPTLPWAVPTAKVGNNPIGVAVDRATNTIYVANALSNSVSVIDLKNLKEITRIPVGQVPKRNITALLP